MTIYHRGDWHYDLNIWPREGKFIWYVVRLKVGLRNVLGTLVDTGIATSRKEAEREGVAVIEHDSKGCA